MNTRIRDALWMQLCFAASFCSGLAQRVSDARVHAAHLPYLRLILPPRALPSLYVAASDS